MANNISIMEALRRVSKTAQEYALKNTPHVISEEVLLTIPASSINKDDYNTAINGGGSYYIQITDTIPSNFDENDEYFIKYNNVEYPCIYDETGFGAFDSNFRVSIVLSEAMPTSLDDNNGIAVHTQDAMNPPYITIIIMDTTNITDIQLISKQVQRLDNMFLQKDLNIGNSISIGRNGEIGTYSSAIGLLTEASGQGSHAEGYNTKAIEDYAHAEGCVTNALGYGSHTEGSETEATGIYSHAEGSITTADGDSSHAEGSNTITSIGAYAAHAEGYFTKASSQYQHVQGRYNIEDVENKFAHIVGNGANDSTTNWKEVRSNAHTLDWNGNAWYAGDVQANNVPYIASESVVLTVPAATIIENKDAIDNSSVNSPYRIDVTDIITFDNSKSYFIKYNNNEYVAPFLDYGAASSDKKCTCSFYPLEQDGGNGTRVSFFNLDTTNITDLQLIEKDIKRLSNFYLKDDVYIGRSLTVGYRSGDVGLCSATFGMFNEAVENSVAEGWQTSSLGLGSHAEGSSSNRFQDVLENSSGGSSSGGGQIPMSIDNTDQVVVMSMDDIAILSSPAIINGGVKKLFSSISNNSMIAVQDGQSSIDDNQGYEPALMVSMWKNTKFNAASGQCSHSEGLDSLALGGGSHVGGMISIAYGDVAYAYGEFVTAYGEASHAEGISNANFFDMYDASNGNVLENINILSIDNQFSIAFGPASHIEGRNTIATGDSSHAEGENTQAVGTSSHAEGLNTLAASNYSHVEGQQSTASGVASHAEGFIALASGKGAHAEGQNTQSMGDASHAEGQYSQANGVASHAEGYKTEASANYSHAEGEGTQATVQSQHVEGKWNLPVENAAHIVGNGKGNTDRGNAYVLDWDGNAHFDGKVKQNGVPTEDNDLATKKYVDENSSKVADGFVMNDQEQDGYRYLIQMKSGVLTSTLLPSSITVDTASLEGVTFMDGDAIDVETLTFIAQYPDGSTSTITDTENLSYEPADLTTDVTQVSFVYNIGGLKLTYDMPITVTAFDPAVKLQDFEYTTNSDGTYTLTGWKETYNGVASTELIIPNNKRIIL